MLVLHIQKKIRKAFGCLNTQYSISSFDALVSVRLSYGASARDTETMLVLHIQKKIRKAFGCLNTQYSISSFDALVSVRLSYGASARDTKTMLVLHIQKKIRKAFGSVIRIRGIYCRSTSTSFCS